MEREAGVGGGSISDVEFSFLLVGRFVVGSCVGYLIFIVYM